MKMTVWDRILSAISGVLITAAGLCLLDIGLGTSLLGVPWVSSFAVWWQRAVVIVVALLLIALGVHGIVLLFRRRHEKGFIIQHSEYGDMSISMNALESMVHKCVDSHQELQGQCHANPACPRGGSSWTSRLRCSAGSTFL